MTMLTVRSPRWWTLGFLALGAFAVCALVPLSASAQKGDQSTSAYMRKKLDASSKILEGITTEDAAMIKDGAATLLEMSRGEKWNVITDADYRELNQEFRSAVRKLQTAAEGENFDNAALQWFDAVKGCVECHKYMRKPLTKK